MSRPARTPLRDRIPADPNGTHHTVEGEPASITKHVPRPSLTGTVVEPAPVSAAYQAIEADRLWAETMATSGMLPESYRGKPQNVIWAIGYARELNIPTMTALNEIYLSKGGKPTMTSQLMAALVRRAGHTLRVKLNRPHNQPITKVSATAEIIRSDDREFTFEETWDIRRARQAGLLQIVNGNIRARSKEGAPMPWEQYPEAMMVARAISAVLRMSCQDVLLGVVYTPEELGAVVDDEGRPVDLGEDGEGFVTYDELGGFDGPDSDMDEPDAPTQEEREEWGPLIPDTNPGPGPNQAKTFDPATADLGEWDEMIHRAAEDAEVDTLNWLYMEAGQHQPTNTELLEMFRRVQKRFQSPASDLNPNEF